jgi:hypothetical protein
MFSWSMFLFAVLVFSWLVPGEPAGRRARTGFILIGVGLLLLAFLALCGVGPVVVRHG